jgi:hypothetical protein
VDLIGATNVSRGGQGQAMERGHDGRREFGRGTQRGWAVGARVGPRGASRGSVSEGGVRPE